MLRTIASLRLTLGTMAALAAGALSSYERAGASAWWVAGPLAVLALNLLAAIATDRRLRERGALLVFHLCLLGIVCLAAYGRLVRFDGRLEISEGQTFDPAAVQPVAEGPWHRWTLPAKLFRQGRVTVGYAPGLLRRETASEVWLRGAGGGEVRAEVGDDRPLTAAGYRFYTTSNKGFAVVLRWQDRTGGEQVGVIDMPSFPLFAGTLVHDWRAPDGERLRLRLKIPGLVQRDRAWVLHSERISGALTVERAGKASTVLHSGQVLGLAGGRLYFDGLRLWMGYRVRYDPTLPWLLAAALLAVGALAWHYWARLPTGRSVPRNNALAVGRMGRHA